MSSFTALLSKFPFPGPEKQSSVRSVDSGGTTDSADSTDTIDDSQVPPKSPQRSHYIPFLRQSAHSTHHITSKDVAGEEEVEVDDEELPEVEESDSTKTDFVDSSSEKTITPVRSGLSIETSTSQTAPSSSSSSANPAVAYPIQQEELLLRQQRERLLHLRHASRCQYHSGTKCPVSPYCSKLKQLWQHMTRCHNDYCNVALCASSRYLLSHYAACHDEECGLCVPLKSLYKRGLSEKELLSSPIPSGKKVKKSNSRDSIMLMKVVQELSNRGINSPKNSPQEQKSTKDVAKSMLNDDSDQEDETRSMKVPAKPELRSQWSKDEEEDDLSVLLQQLQIVDSPSSSSSSSSSARVSPSTSPASSFSFMSSFTTSTKPKKPAVEASNDSQVMLEKVFQIIDHIQHCHGQCSLGNNCSRTKKLLLHYQQCQNRQGTTSTSSSSNAMVSSTLQNEQCYHCQRIHAVLTLHQRRRQLPNITTRSLPT